MNKKLKQEKSLEEKLKEFYGLTVLTDDEKVQASKQADYLRAIVDRTLERGKYWFNYWEDVLSDNEKKFLKWDKIKYHIFAFPQLFNNLIQIKLLARKEEQDWIFAVCGKEGAGKSTLAIEAAYILDPDISFSFQLTTSLEEYLGAIIKYRNQPFKSIILDEAVLLFFARESSDKVSRKLVKIHVANRSFRHFYFLNIPDFFYLDKYFRVFRIKTLLFSFINPYVQDKNGRFFRAFGFYTAGRLIELNRKREFYEPLMLQPIKFLENLTPSFIEVFPPVKYFFSGNEQKYWEEYSMRKKAMQENLLNEISHELTGMSLEELEQQVELVKTQDELTKVLKKKYEERKKGRVGKKDSAKRNGDSQEQ